MFRRLLPPCFLILTVLAAHSQSNHFVDTLSQLDRHGLSFSLAFSNDTLVGSRATASSPKASAFQFLDLAADLGLAHLSSHLSGTRAFTSLHLNGTYAADFSGAYQSPAGLICSPGIHLGELWIEHGFGKSAQIRVGKIDANTNFALVENATGFLNAAFGYDPTFFTLPNYSDTRWGGELFLHRRHLAANLAAFSLFDGTGPLLMEEIGADWQPANWKGRISFGAWQRTGKMLSFHDVNESGARGVYLVGEQKFWRHERRNGRAEQSLSAFVQLGSAPSAFSAFTRHISAGLAWNAPLARRDRDSAGFAITRGRFTTDPAAGFDQSHETVFEAYYRVQLMKQLSVSPDFQYAIHPGGLSANRNTYALGARMIFTLSSHTE